jgi:hypothetical protein
MPRLATRRARTGIARLQARPMAAMVLSPQLQMAGAMLLLRLGTMDSAR